MCWITLSPKHKHHGHHHRHSDGSSVEGLVRISRSTIVDPESYRAERIRVLTPTTISVPTIARQVEKERRLDVHAHLHHHHPHLHPLHMHPHLPHLHPHRYHHHQPIRLHGPGKKRGPPPGPPPPSRCPSKVREPIYRTQIVEPNTREIRETTRIALREVRPERERGRLRRVAGYEVLGRHVPWSWDAVSSVASGRSKGRRERSGSTKFPPFGEAGSWM